MTRLALCFPLVVTLKTGAEVAEEPSLKKNLSQKVGFIQLALHRCYVPYGKTPRYISVKNHLY